MKIARLLIVVLPVVLLVAASSVCMALTTTTTTLTSSLNPSIYGQTVTFTAVVAPAPPNGESVTFEQGSSVLGTGTLSGGTAIFATSTSAGSRRGRDHDYFGFLVESGQCWAVGDFSGERNATV